MTMLMLMIMRMFMRVLMMTMVVAVVVVMMLVPVMMVSVRQMNIKLHPRNPLSFLPPDVKMITVKFQSAQFALQLMRIHAQINERRDEHIARDAAKNIEVKSFHSIWRQQAVPILHLRF